MDHSPYKAGTASLIVPRKPPSGAVLLMAVTGLTLGTLQLVAILWAWHAQAVSRPSSLLLMLSSCALYYGLAYGVHRRSRVCACLLLAYAELHAILVVWLFSPLPAYLLLIPMLLLLILVNGTLAVFRSHRTG